MSLPLQPKMEKTDEFKAIEEKLNQRIVWANKKHPEGASIEALREEFFEAYDEHSDLINHTNVEDRLRIRGRFVDELYDLMTVCARLIHQAQSRPGELRCKK